MYERETAAERLERFNRLLDRLIRQVEKGGSPATLREQLEVATMISPLSGAETVAAFERFDAAVALVEQLDRSLKPRL